MCSIVGASATGVQLADELARAGRDVVLAVGSHSRVPRSYRGMDIYWWLERIGSFDRTIEQMPDPVAARHEPSLQLAGRPDHRALDLGTLCGVGVELVGRLIWTDGRRVGFADDLGQTVATADTRMRRVLAEIDAHIDAAGLTAEVLDAEPPPRHRCRPAARPSRPEGPWHHARCCGPPATGAPIRGSTFPWSTSTGEIRQRRGRTPVPGLYVVGQRFQHYRNSNFIDGVGRDAATVADHARRPPHYLDEPSLNGACRRAP